MNHPDVLMLFIFKASVELCLCGGFFVFKMKG